MLNVEEVLNNVDSKTREEIIESFKRFKRVVGYKIGDIEPIRLEDMLYFFNDLLDSYDDLEQEYEDFQMDVRENYKYMGGNSYDADPMED